MKYIDMAEKITEGSNLSNTVSFRKGVAWALEYLDAHPDQVPGRTITESGCHALYHAAYYGAKAFRGELEDQGFAFIADPEPTNAEKLEQLHQNWSQSDRNPPFGEWADSVGILAPEDWADDD